MPFFSEIYKALSAEAGAGLEYTVVEGHGGYFQNVKKIAKLSQDCIELRGKKRGVCIYGEALSLSKYCGGDVAISGKIIKVEEVG